MCESGASQVNTVSSGTWQVKPIFSNASNRKKFENQWPIDLVSWYLYCSIKVGYCCKDVKNFGLDTPRKGSFSSTFFQEMRSTTDAKSLLPQGKMAKVSLSLEKCTPGLLVGCNNFSS